MERDRELNDAIIDLGKASVETLGPQGGLGDDVISQQRTGLADD